MRSRTFLLFCGLLAEFAAASQGQMTGYVTRAASGSDFDVNGYHIVCGGVKRGTVETVRGVMVPAVGCPSDAPFVGEALTVHGRGDRPRNSVSIFAKRIEIARFDPGLPSYHPDEESGSAVIDAQPAQEATGTEPAGLLVRADGYWIRISGQTEIKWIPPLQSFADVKAGDWIKYKGRLDGAGVMDAATAQIGPIAIGNGEEKLRDHKEYDPSAVPVEARQNLLNDALRWGFDPTKFPPFKDAGMQARIEKIGASLIPAYQRALPDSDPAKLDFRFQLIDTKLIRGTLTLPNGIVLIPHQVVERMQNDSQLAAILADAIACAMERQQYRTKGERLAANATTLAGFFAPFGAVMIDAGTEAASEIKTNEMDQSGRVSLALLHDAGYDIDQAPLGWWRLVEEKEKPLTVIYICRNERRIFIGFLAGAGTIRPRPRPKGARGRPQVLRRRPLKRASLGMTGLWGGSGLCYPRFRVQSLSHRFD